MSSNAVGEALGSGQSEASDVSSLEAVGEIAALLRRSGQDVLLAGAAFGFVILGVLAQAHTIKELVDPLAPIRLSLFVAIIGGLLRGITLLALTSSHLLRPLSMLRRLTGASAKSGWSPVLVKAPEPPRAELFRHIQLMVAAAHHRCYLAHGALLWALGSVGCFVLWTSLNAASGTG
jgi:hypothetical protein